MGSAGLAKYVNLLMTCFLAFNQFQLRPLVDYAWTTKSISPENFSPTRCPTPPSTKKTPIMTWKTTMMMFTSTRISLTSVLMKCLPAPQIRYNPQLSLILGSAPVNAINLRECI
jgi:hypothetical protein